MIYVGIDPGITGAVAVISDTLLSGDKAIEFYDTPTLQIKSGKTIKNVIDIAAAVGILRKFGPTTIGNVCVIIEKVQAMPGKSSAALAAAGESRQSMGATSAFNFGMGYGIWLGIIGALNIPYEQVHPATWKGKMMAGMTKDKDASRSRALQLFPQAAESLKLKKHHGRADALLIAEWGRRTNHYP